MPLILHIFHATAFYLQNLIPSCCTNTFSLSINSLTCSASLMSQNVMPKHVGESTDNERVFLQQVGIEFL